MATATTSKSGYCPYIQLTASVASSNDQNITISYNLKYYTQGYAISNSGEACSWYIQYKFGSGNWTILKNKNGEIRGKDQGTGYHDSGKLLASGTSIAIQRPSTDSILSVRAFFGFDTIYWGGKNMGDRIATIQNLGTIKHYIAPTYVITLKKDQKNILDDEIDFANITIPGAISITKDSDTLKFTMPTSSKSIAAPIVLYKGYVKTGSKTISLADGKITYSFYKFTSYKYQWYNNTNSMVTQFQPKAAIYTLKRGAAKEVTYSSTNAMFIITKNMSKIDSADTIISALENKARTLSSVEGTKRANYITFGDGTTSEIKKYYMLHINQDKPITTSIKNPSVESIFDGTTTFELNYISDAPHKYRFTLPKKEDLIKYEYQANNQKYGIMVDEDFIVDLIPNDKDGKWIFSITKKSSPTTVKNTDAWINDFFYQSVISNKPVQLTGCFKVQLPIMHLYVGTGENKRYLNIYYKSTDDDEIYPMALYYLQRREFKENNE